jgi:hypothetical protein
MKGKLGVVCVVWAVLLGAGSASAAPPSAAVLQALEGHDVVIELVGGLLVQGRLLQMGVDQVVLMLEDGRIIEISRDQVAEIDDSPVHEHHSSPRSDCPWQETAKPMVAATSRTVTVNGEAFDVKGPAARAQFHEVLRRCDAEEASEAFDRWRARRRGVNLHGTVALTGLVVPLGLFYAPVEGVVAAVEGFNAKARKREMLDQLRWAAAGR